MDCLNIKWLLLLTFAALVFAKSGDNKGTTTEIGDQGNEQKALPEMDDDTKEEDGANGLVDRDAIQSSHVQRTGNENEKRNAARTRWFMWRTRIVPYVLDSSLSAKAKRDVREAINEFEKKSCIRFKSVARSSKKTKLVFRHRTVYPNCFVQLGKSWKKEQDLDIGSACHTSTKGGVMRELMASLSFFYEHNRYDRDEYIKINDSNIIDGKKNEFRKVPFIRGSLLGLPYDYDSIMHYGSYRYAKDPRYPVIVKRTESGGPLGNIKGFSVTDIKRLNILYDCKTSSVTNSWSSWSPYSQCYYFRGNVFNRKRSQRFCFKEDKSLCAGADWSGLQKRYKSCAGGVKTGSAICNTKYTSWKFEHLGYMKTLDYHRMKCGFGYVLNMFHLEYEKLGVLWKIRYKYDCCSIGLASYCTTEPRQSFWMDGPHDQTHYLSRIMAMCGWRHGSNGFISDMRLEHSPDNRRFRYNYQCCIEASAYHHKSSCATKFTRYTSYGNGKSYNLHKQTVQCAKGYALSFYQLESDAKSWRGWRRHTKWRYTYICCKIGV